MPDVSVVIPLYNEEESLSELNDWISRVMQSHGFTYEVIFVDDGSTDRSWAIVEDLNQKFEQVRGIRFNRNFGKSAALNTGFKASSGKVVISMDADLQDSPDEIPELYRMITEEGFDMVSGWKKVRHDPLSKTIPSRFFNSVTRQISGIKLHDFNCGLKAYRGEVVKHIQVYGEMHRYIPVIAKWNGYKQIGEKVVEHRPRKYGTTKFGLERFITGFLDLLSVTFVSKFRQKPMHLFGTLGTLSFLSGFFITLWLIGQKVYGIYAGKEVREVVDQPLFFLALVALVVGVQLFLAGFLAEMMAMRSQSSKEYLVSKRVGFE
ncbi:glycosyltransferase family 2 protein [Fulvivirga sedimenti]|uniref:Glycosyltransferase family 2 protein n=1 Tax=Fulvivirga sedimenti TaxID=2879465 RepID=A0A9X1HV45_9BACT|nr:glycosyltransferase family 2 protein [Fulvivirga sedimenti]MCA6075313.1 glycosyltransferase family 2 protein [Fulvivirga sedimenti]MCA6076490.1 glycosyltransferase family 2 protein [Fulvivirga sedimenti]MCA6077618.1 glycosyltransferase family 2 protein [Fulvivirga sedimenti]